MATNLKIRRFAVAAAKVAILALVVWGGHRTIASALSDLQQRGWSLNRLQPGWAFLAGILYLTSQIPSGWFWQRILNQFGGQVGLLRALRAYFIGHLGKYVPGKAMVVVLRAALVGQPHVRTSMAVVAVFYETFTTMACGAAIASMYLLVAHRENRWLLIASLAVTAAVGLPTLPAVFRRLLRVMRLTRADPSVAVAVDVASTVPNPMPIQFSAKLLIQGWVMIVVGWMLAGASLWAILRSIGIDTANLIGDLPLYTATIALAVVLGFVSMIPAGFGVRDIALLELLVPHIETLMSGQGKLMAFVAVIVLRLVWLAAEVVISAVLFALGRRLRAMP